MEREREPPTVFFSQEVGGDGSLQPNGFAETWKTASTNRKSATSRALGNQLVHINVPI